MKKAFSFSLSSPPPAIAERTNVKKSFGTDVYTSLYKGIFPENVRFLRQIVRRIGHPMKIKIHLSLFPPLKDRISKSPLLAGVYIVVNEMFTENFSFLRSVEYKCKPTTP